MNKRLYFVCVLVSIIIGNSSCSSILLSIKLKNNLTEDIRVLYNQSSERTIVFMPVAHLGKKGYYESVKYIVDSLRTEGFVFFYERVNISDSSISEADKITYYKKFRKILGFHNSFDKNNKSLPGFYYSNKYVRQDYEKMGITELADNNVDVPVNGIIDSVEMRYGKILLDSCDINTPLNSVYKCNTLKGYQFYALHNSREPYIIKTVLGSPHKKIAMIYGGAHWQFIYPGLRDAGFKLIKGKI